MTTNPLPLYWWCNKPNFGDQLSPVIISHLLQRPVIHTTTASPKLFAIGSVLQQYSQPGDIVWGTGAWFGHEDWSGRGITYLAVRGPLTRDYVLRKGGDCPKVFGDPALLLPMIYPADPDPKHSIVAMPHIDDDIGWSFAHYQGLTTINPGWEWKRVTDGILSAAHLVTSSLHGLIVAEAYGIPVTWAEFLPPTKFKDYFLGVNRLPSTPLEWPAAIKNKPSHHLQEPPPDLLSELIKNQDLIPQ